MSLIEMVNELDGKDLLITVVVAIGRNGDVHASTTTHGNPWGEVYRGMHGVKAEIDRMIGERRECPFNPKNKDIKP